jgi:hypothetical protein
MVQVAPYVHDEKSLNGHGVMTLEVSHRGGIQSGQRQHPAGVSRTWGAEQSNMPTSHPRKAAASWPPRLAIYAGKWFFNHKTL